MVIDDAIGTAHDHNNIIMSGVIIYMHYVNCTCAREVCALRALVIILGTARLCIAIIIFCSISHSISGNYRYKLLMSLVQQNVQQTSVATMNNEECIISHFWLLCMAS